MAEAMPGKDDSHSSCQHPGEASNCTVFSDRLGLFVSSMHAPLSSQQRILLSLNGILKKLLLRISSYHTHYYQGMKTFLWNRCSLLICRVFRVRLSKRNNNILHLIVYTLHSNTKVFIFGWSSVFHGKDSLFLISAMGSTLAFICFLKQLGHSPWHSFQKPVTHYLTLSQS